jgi:Acyl-CoA carboxylase epsilon subunit
MPARLVRGNVSSDELSAVVAVVAILAAASSDGDQGQTEGDCPGGYPQSRWSSPGRMVRMTYPHGPGGWRASAFPR